MEQETEEWNKKYSHTYPASYKRLLEQHGRPDLRELDNYDPETDTLVPSKNIFNPETGMIEHPDGLTRARANLINLTEAFLFGRELSPLNEMVEIKELKKLVTGIAGELSGSLLLSWLSMLTAGALISSSSGSFKRLGTTGKVVETGLKTTVARGLYHEGKALIGDKEVDEQAKLDNTAFSVSAGIGRIITDTVLQKYLPDMPLVYDKLISSVGSVMFGYLGNFYKYEEPEEFFEDVFSLDTFIFIMSDMLAYAYRSNKEGTPEYVTRQFEKLDKAIKVYAENPTLDNYEALWEEGQKIVTYASEVDNLASLLQSVDEYGHKIKASTDSFLEIAEKLNLTGVLAELDQPNINFVTDIMGNISFSDGSIPTSHELLRLLPEDMTKDTKGELVKSVGDVRETIKKNPSEILSATLKDPSREFILKDVFKDNEEDYPEVILQKIREEGVSPEEAERLAKGKPADGTALLNTSRIDASPIVRKSIESLFEANSEFVSTTLSDIKEKTVLDMYKDPQGTLEKIDKIMKDHPDFAEAWTASRILAVNAQKQLEELSNDPEKLKKMSKEDLGKLYYLQTFAGYASGLAGDIGSGLGQGLSAGRINVGDEDIDILKLFGNEAETYIDWYNAGIEEYGSEKELKKQMTSFMEIYPLTDQSTREDLFTEDSKASLQRIVDVVLEYTQNNLISSTLTATRVLLSQAVNTPWDIATDLLGASYSAVGRRLVGEDRFGRGIRFRDVVAKSEGYWEAMTSNILTPVITFRELAELEGKPEKFDRAMDYVKMRIADPKAWEEYWEKTSPHPYRGYTDTDGKAITSKNFEDWISNIENESVQDVVSTVVDFTGAQLRLAGTGKLSVVSRTVEEMNYRGELNSLISRLDKSPEEAQKIKENVLKLRVMEKHAFSVIKELETEFGRSLTPTEKKVVTDNLLEPFGFKDTSAGEMRLYREINKASTQMGRRSVLQHDFENEFAQATSDFLDEHNFLKLFARFMKTRLKTVGEMFRRTGVFNRKKLNDLLGRTKTFDGKVDRHAQMKALGELTGSIIVIGTTMRATKKGYVTPVARNKAERDLARENGTPEMSLRIGNKWVSLPIFGALGMTMAITANATRNVLEYRHSKDSDNPDKEYENFTEVMVDTLQDSLTIMTAGPAMIGTRNLLDLMTGRADPTNWVEKQKESFNPLRGFGTDIKSLRTYQTESVFDNRPVLDSWGKPVINSVLYSKKVDSPIRQELLELKLKLPNIPEALGGVPLDEEQVYLLKLILDKEVKAEDKMNEFIKSPSYKKLSSHNQRIELKDKWAKYVLSAQTKLIEDWDTYREIYKDYLKADMNWKYFGQDRDPFWETIGGKGQSSSSGQSDERGYGWKPDRELSTLKKTGGYDINK